MRCRVVVVFAAAAAINIALGEGRLCLTRPEGSRLVDLRPCNGEEDQEWVMSNDNVQSRKDPTICLQVEGEDASTGSVVSVDSCNNQPPQSWAHTSEGGLATRLDESLCLDGKDKAVLNGTAVLLRACGGKDHVQLGPSVALLQKYEQEFRDEDLEAIAQLAMDMNHLVSFFSSYIGNAVDPWKSRFQMKSAQVSQLSRKVATMHQNNAHIFHKIQPEVKRLLEEAVPIFQLAQELYAGQTNVNPQAFQKGKAEFIAIVMQMEITFMKEYQAMMKAANTKTQGFYQANGKAWMARQKVAAKFMDGVWKNIKKGEKSVEKAQGKYSGQVVDNLGDLESYLLDTYAQQEDFAMTQEEIRASMGSLLEDGNSENPSARQMVESVTEAKEEFDEYTQERAGEAEEMWAENIEKAADKMMKINEYLVDQSEKQTARPMATLEKYADKVQNSIAKLAMKVTGNGVKSAAKQQNALKKAVQYEKFLDLFAKKVDTVKSTVLDLNLDHFKQTMADGLENIIEWSQKRLPADHTALENYVANSQSLLEANVEQKLAAVDKAGGSQLQEIWLHFLKSEMAMNTKGKKTQAGIEALKVPVENIRGEVQKNLNVATQILDINDAVNSLPHTVAKEANAVKVAADDMRKQGNMRFLGIVKGYDNSIVKKKTKTDDLFSTVNEEQKKIIRYDHGVVGSEVSKMANDNQDRADTMKRSMVDAEQELDHFLATLEHQASWLDRDIPTKLEAFGNYFKEGMKTHSYELKEALTELHDFSDNAFATSKENIAELIAANKKETIAKVDENNAKVSALVKYVQDMETEEEVRVAQDNGDLKTKRNELQKEGGKPLIKAFDMGKRFQEKFDTIVRKLNKAMEMVARVKQQNQEGRDAVATKAKDDTGVLQEWYGGEVTDTGKKIGKRVNELVKGIMASLSATRTQSEEQLKQNSDIIAGKFVELERVVSILRGLTSHIIDSWTSGVGSQALDSWSSTLGRMDKAIQDTAGMPMVIAKNTNEINEAVAKKIALAHEQFALDDQKIAKTTTAGLQKSKEQMKDNVRKSKSRLEEVDQSSTLKFNALRSIATDTAATVVNSERRLDAEASAVERHFAAQEALEKENNRETMLIVEEGKAKMKRELQVETGNVEVLGRKLQRVKAESERANNEINHEVDNVFGTLDVSAEVNNMEAQIMVLENKEKGEGKEAGGGSSEAEAAISEMVEQANKRASETTKVFGDQSNELTALSEEQGREFGWVRDFQTEDEDKVRGLLESFHTATKDLSTKIQDEQDRVEAKHKKNEDALASMAGLTEYSEGDALERVVNAVKSQEQLDYELRTDVDYRVLPQMNYWREGLAEVFEQMGADLDLDSITEKAKQALAKELMQRDQIGGANNELEALLRAEMLTARLGQRKVDKHMREMIDDIMSRNDLSTAEKLRLIQQHRDAFQRKHISANQKIAMLLDEQGKASMKMSGMTNGIEGMLKRAKTAAKPHWKPESTMKLSMMRTAMLTALQDTKDDMTLQIQATADARAKNKKETKLLQLSEGASLLQTGELSSETISEFRSMASKMQDAEAKRDEDDDEWEKELDEAEGSLTKNLRSNGAPLVSL